jgi:hypothetical protein
MKSHQAQDEIIGTIVREAEMNEMLLVIIQELDKVLES